MGMLAGGGDRPRRLVSPVWAKRSGGIGGTGEESGGSRMSDDSGVRVMVLVGSLRAGSINRQLAELAVEMSPAGATLELFDRLGELPFYNEDIDGDPAGDGADHGGVADAVAALRDAAARADAALVVTPEYNGSIPGVLKNAIDWLSRPFGNGGLKGKPLAVVGAALGRYGGVWAHDETRKSFGIAGARIIEDLDLSIPAAPLGGDHPREHPDIAERLGEVVTKLITRVG